MLYQRGVDTHGAEFELYGASPESNLKYRSANREVQLYPIAGTRPRGLAEDGTVDHELEYADGAAAAHECERDRRAHDALRPRALDAYRACMNMGTLTGAPKLRATSLIRSLEGTRRGSYGGAVGYLDSNGDFDTCIVIRSAYITNGCAVVQAGAGVVRDSNPQSEANETVHKAYTVLNVIASAAAAELEVIK
ncbi:hypothetical protein BJP07_06850 [Corynebacterium sp. NML130628]|nr:hypothetical protein BJP07_06850 [Corynebacterium sp. NML130628]